MVIRMIDFSSFFFCVYVLLIEKKIYHNFVTDLIRTKMLYLLYFLLYFV